MNYESAELTKIAINIFLASSVTNNKRPCGNFAKKSEKLE